MIQRIQTVYLLLATILMGLTFLFPLLWVNVPPTAFYALTVFGVEAKAAEPYGMTFDQGLLLASTILAVYAPLRTTFSYGNRRRQMRWVVYSVLIVILQLLAVAFSAYMLMKTLPQASFTPNWVLLLPIGAIALCILAYRAIRRDDEKIRSIDRIR